MKYRNAADVLPEELLAQVQKYAAGELLYVPTPEKQKNWGEKTGFREKLLRRNRVIRSLYQSGSTISELAEDFYLSVDSIKKIVYGKQEPLPAFSPDMESARRYSEAGMAEEWVRLLLKTRCHADFPQGEIFVTGLVKMPLRLIRSDPDAECPPTEAAVEPLVAVFRRNAFHAPFQPAVHHALMQAHTHTCYAFILIGKDDLPAYRAGYGKHFLE